MLSDADGDVRLTAIRGLAVSKTAEATQAVGRALGDASAPTRKFAEDVVSDWGRTSPDRARLAIEAALATGSPQAETAAARVTAATATIQDPANVLPLLSSQLPEVRVYALKTLQYCLLGSPMRQNPQLLEKIGALIEAPNEPHEVKAAALDLVGYCSLEAGGGWALKILRTSSDFDLRAKAALAIAAAKPEGAYTAVMDAVTERDLRRVVRIACLIALERLPSPPREQVLPYATRLLDLVDDEDQTISGLALLAMRKVTGKPDAVYDKARWHAWYERRRWEEKLAARVLALLDKAKAEYEKSDPKDPEKAAKEPVLNNATQVLQDHVGPKSKAVDDNDRAALQAVVNRVVEWHTELKKAWATQR